MNFVMFPSQALRDSDPTPLVLSQESKRARLVVCRVLGFVVVEEIVVGNVLPQERLGQDNMSVLKVVISVTV
jgi:hypothetical protein